MLTLIALSAVLMQDPPAPPAPPAPPEVHTRMIMMGPDGPGGLDKDGDGQISRDEFAAPMNDHFARMDKDGDGRLSTEEMAAGHGPGEHEVMIRRGPGGEGGPGMRHREMRHPGGPGAHNEERTMVIVGGRPGAMGEGEMMRRGPGGEGGPHVFVMPHGADRSGEQNVIVRRMGGPGGENDLDADNDGKISEAEFTTPMREAFTLMDADHSGFIEASERGQGHEIQVFTQQFKTRQESED